MSNVIPLLNTLPTSIVPADVGFLDPPMCCPTGLCGLTLDQTLLDINEMIQPLQRENLRVERYQMTSHPSAFLGNAQVMKLVREKEMASLPIIVVRGKVIKIGAYPTLDEIRTALNGTVKRLSIKSRIYHSCLG
ncbi:MAG: arsenic metallochaperone ArsD family protein [Chloroflexi bacterium]|nr:arsenic metallochaperone ArsD family protein [Chloroflexota bacterium]